jgi:MerR family Zn(II)-responsive transcriptional regulator of zntA
MHTMKVNELAKAAGVSADTVRHYARLGLIQANRAPANGYRFFPVSAVQRLKFIKAAQRLGFSLQDIQLIFQDADKGHSPCPRVRQVIAARIEASAAQIRELEETHRRMQLALEQWDSMSDGTPDGHSVCRLIESQE